MSTASKEIGNDVVFSIFRISAINSTKPEKKFIEESLCLPPSMCYDFCSAFNCLSMLNLSDHKDSIKFYYCSNIIFYKCRSRREKTRKEITMSSTFI